MSAGMDVARLNFSHGTYPEHAALMKAVRVAARKVGKTVAILQDLQGPKIRVGDLGNGVMLHAGETVTFSAAKNAKAADGVIPLTYERLGKDVKPGHRILLDDGYLEVEVLKTKGALEVTAVVKVAGLLKSHKGANFPDSSLLVSAFTAKDHKDLLFGVQHEVDWICLSFVTNPQVLEGVRALIKKTAKQFGVRPPLLMAKVERRAALDCLDEIIDASDAIMLGRGDLGVEIPPEEVPIAQKEVVEHCRLAGKPVIVATQMLESMRDNPRATRAEFSDVANAVFDHADAVMLSAESAAGKYPAVSVQAMASVIREAEKSRFDDVPEDDSLINCLPSALAHTLAVMARREIIRGIVIASSFGPAVGSLLMFRPQVPVIVVVPDESAARQAMLHIGVTPMVLDDHGGTFVPRMHALLHSRVKLPKGKCVAYITNTGGGVSLSLIAI